LLRRGLFALLALLLLSRAASAVEIPSIGCAADGQQGAQSAPVGATKVVEIEPKRAALLAYYDSPFTGTVLAPRGWKCFAYYGAAGSHLIVARDDVPGPLTQKVTGPAVSLATFDGEIGGGYAVAEYLTLVFPDQAEPFVSDFWKSREIKPIRLGPFPNDKRHQIGASRIESETPGFREGLGTSGVLKKSGLPILGMIDYHASDSQMRLLTAKLPSDLQGLKAEILQDFAARIDKRYAK